MVLKNIKKKEKSLNQKVSTCLLRFFQAASLGLCSFFFSSWLFHGQSSPWRLPFSCTSCIIRISLSHSLFKIALSYLLLCSLAGLFHLCFCFLFCLFPLSYCNLALGELLSPQLLHLSTDRQDLPLGNFRHLLLSTDSLLNDGATEL